MIKNIDQLQKAVQAAEARRDQLKAELQKAEQAFMDDPGNDALAMETAKLELHIRAAEKGVKRASDEYQAEHDRLTGPEAQEAIKELEKINQEGVKLTADLTKACEALHKKMIQWEDLQKQSRRIAKRYNQDPFDLGIAGSRLRSVKIAIDRWVREVHSWKRNLEIMANQSPGGQPVKHNYTREQQIAMNARYRKEGEQKRYS